MSKKRAQNPPQKSVDHEVRFNRINVFLTIIGILIAVMGVYYSARSYNKSLAQIKLESWKLVYSDSSDGKIYSIILQALISNIGDGNISLFQSNCDITLKNSDNVIHCGPGEISKLIPKTGLYEDIKPGVTAILESELPPVNPTLDPTVVAKSGERRIVVELPGETLPSQIYGSLNEIGLIEFWGVLCTNQNCYTYSQSKSYKDLYVFTTGNLTEEQLRGKLDARADSLPIMYNPGETKEIALLWIPRYGIDNDVIEKIRFFLVFNDGTIIDINL